MLSEVPIKELREDKRTELDLSRKGLGPTEAIVLGELLKGGAALTPAGRQFLRHAPNFVQLDDPSA